MRRVEFPWKPVRSGNQPTDIAEWCCTAASSFPLKPGAKPGCHFRKSRTRMESTGTGAPQHERRNALFNPPRNKSGRPLPWPPRPALSCRAGLICGRIEDDPASDYPHKQESRFDAGRPCKRNEVSMIHLGDITKSTVMKSSRWTASRSAVRARICPLRDVGRDLPENDPVFC